MWKIALGVGFDDGLCLLSCQLNELAIACYVGYLQVKGYTALLCSLQVAWSAKFQVGFGYPETIVGVAHDVDSFSRILAQFIVGYQDAVALVASSSHSSSQLVQL